MYEDIPVDEQLLIIQPHHDVPGRLVVHQIQATVSPAQKITFYSKYLLYSIIVLMFDLHFS